FIFLVRVMTGGLGTRLRLCFRWLFVHRARNRCAVSSWLRMDNPTRPTLPCRKSPGHTKQALAQLFWNTRSNPGLERQLLLSAFQQPEMSEDRTQNCADQPLDATARRRMRRSTRRSRRSSAFGLAPAAVAAAAVLLMGFAAIPNRYVARTGFVVDWQSVPSASYDEQAASTRNELRNTIIAEVTSLPYSDAEVSDILDRAGDPTPGESGKAVAISKFRRRLRVDLASQTDDCDRFVIQMRNSDPGLAQAEANRVLQGIVSRLKTESRMGNGTAPLHSELALNQLEPGHVKAGPDSSINLAGTSFIKS